MAALLDNVTGALAGSIRFSCTKCGHCCHNLNLPLTWNEAIAWLEEGGKVDIYCEADLWPSEPSAEDLRAAHRKRRSFQAACGATHVRITAIFVAAISGACKNLTSEMTCGIYDRRPLVCRIYPAEINPFIQLNPANKACPSEAWGSGEILTIAGKVTDPSIQALIEKSRQTDQDEAPQKDLLCRHLGLNVAALHRDGFIKYTPEPKTLLDGLHRMRGATLKSAGDGAPWRLYSPRTQTRELLRANGAELAVARPEDRYCFLAA